MAHLRFTSAFDEEIIELQPRSLEQPFTVGRASDCDLQVPSVNIAPRHCVFFQHKGRWAVQDGGSDAGTFVNGVRLTAPRPLRDGDVVTLGQDADPPTLVAEGADLGPRPDAPSAGAPGAAPPAFVASVVAPPATQEPYIASIVTPPADDEPYIAEVIAPAAASAPEPAADDWFSQPAPVARTGSRRPSASSAAFQLPKRRGMSPGAWIATLLLTGGVCVGGYFIYQNQHPVVIAPPPPPPPPTTIFVPEEPEKTNSIFDFGVQGEKKPPAKTPVTPADPPAADLDLPAPAPTPTSRPGVDPDDITASNDATSNDPEKQSDEWQAIQSALSGMKGFELVKACQDFTEFHPDTKLGPEINKYLNQGCDWIWWDRIDELLTENAALNTQIKSVSDDWALSHDPAFKKGLSDQRDALRDELAHNQDELNNQMGYVGNMPPNMLDRPAIAKLRAARDPKIFEQFKKTVEGSIRRSNKLPWQS